MVAFENFLRRSKAMAIVMRVLPFDGGTTTMWFFLEPPLPDTVIWATAIAIAV